MEVRDSRRLTGVNLQVDGPAAVAEVAFKSEEDADASVAAWRAALAQILPQFGLGDAKVFCRRYRGGASMGFTAPIDRLYAATEMNEWAVEVANAECAGAQAPDPKTRASAIRSAISEESNPRLRALQEAAAAHGVPFLWDDDFASVGYGLHSFTWPADSLPEVDSVDWKACQAIPVVVVTGTNGKTTTSRLLTRILTRAGYAVGNTSTDGVSVNEEMVEEGDWTGPGAARTVLRRKDVSAAVLETARGGLLRRGLGVEACDVALVTNVAEDHLGEYGIEDVQGMAEVKSLVYSIVRKSGRCVLNADDPELMALRSRYGSPITLTSLHAHNPAVEEHRDLGGEAWVLQDDHIMRFTGHTREYIVDIREVPFTFEGNAVHNVSNALAASAAASALGVERAALVEGLRSFGACADDNPGRCEFHQVEGVRLLLDFGHNPHGVDAILSMARRLYDSTPGARLCVSLGQAGDRSDEDIEKLALTVKRYEPDHVIVRNVAGYERGRARGEVQRIIRDVLLNAGMASEAVALYEDEIETLEAAFEWARPGDLVVILVHLKRADIRRWIEARGGSESSP